MKPDRADGARESAIVPPRCLDKKAAARYIGTSDDTVERLINAGELPIVKYPVSTVDPHGTSRRVLIDVRDLDALIDRNKETRGPAVLLGKAAIR